MISCIFLSIVLNSCGAYLCKGGQNLGHYVAVVNNGKMLSKMRKADATPVAIREELESLARMGMCGK